MENTFEVGQQVTILDINKVGEVVSVSDVGVTVKYTDDAGAEQTEIVTADKLAPVSEAKPDEDEKTDGEAEAEKGD